MKADLHIHTKYSDGELTPTQVVEACSTYGLDVIALCDHDNVGGVREAKFAATKTDKLKVVSGIELSAFDDEKEVHMLVYGIDVNNEELQEKITKIKDMRENRNLKMVERFAQLGITIDYDALKTQYRGEVIGRSHFAKDLIKQGICSTVAEAFAKYLSPTGSAYVITNRLTVEQAVAFAGKFGGISVLAHPSKLRMNTSQAEKFISRLVEIGLKGIEAEYFSHTNVERDFYLYLAERYNLHVFGGSDFHSDTYGVQLGAFYRPAPKTCDLLLELSQK